MLIETEGQGLWTNLDFEKDAMISPLELVRGFAPNGMLE
jgi:hypothetical protein